jgi:hypothetical protein
MGHKHQVKIEKLFEHPTSGNIDARRLLSALEHYGAKVDITKQNKAKIHFRDKEFTLALSHYSDLNKDDISKMRHFLESVNLVPGKL